MECPNCKQQVLDGEKNCWNCGYDTVNGKAPAQKVTKKARTHPRKGVTDRIVSVLKFDIPVFDEIAEKKPWKEIGLFILLDGLLSAFFTLVYSATQNIGVSIFFITGAVATTTFLGLLFSALTVLVMGFLYHLGVKAIGATGDWKSTVAVYGYLYVWNILNTLLGALLVLGLGEALATSIGGILGVVIALVSFIELAYALSRIHETSKLKTAGAILTVTVFVGICLLVMRLVLAAVMMNSMTSNIPMYP